MQLILKRFKGQKLCTVLEDQGDKKLIVEVDLDNVTVTFAVYINNKLLLPAKTLPEAVEAFNSIVEPFDKAVRSLDHG